MIKQTTGPTREQLDKIRLEANALAHLEPDQEVITGYSVAQMGWTMLGKDLEEEARACLGYALRRRGRWALINKLPGLLSFQYVPSWADLRREVLRGVVLNPGPPFNPEAFAGPRHDLSSYYRESLEILEDFCTLYPECERLRG